ncbi:MAG: UDP-2,3-diacylglucosamine diphosphatase [Hyphomicrobiaceae bacterium]
MYDANPNVRSSAAGSRRYRAIFISDVHLGTRTAQATALLDFLRDVEADTIYLVGDIVDFWRVRRHAHWPQAHNDVIQNLLHKARQGAKIVLIPGNHDEGLRAFCGLYLGGVRIVRSCIHTTAGGKRYVVKHGDEFDVVVRTAKWLAILGGYGYEAALWLNNPLNWLRRCLGLGYWSLSAYLKNRVKTAVSFIGAYEDALAADARRHGADGIVCGHIHCAADRRIGPIHYLNCGDWVESCTAIVETAGGLSLVYWNSAPAGSRQPAVGKQTLVPVAGDTALAIADGRPSQLHERRQPQG